VRVWRFVLAVMLGVMAGCAGPDIDTPSPNVIPSRSASASPQPTAPTASPSEAPGGSTEGVTRRYADGLPRTVDGQPVLRGAEALAEARSTTDDESFLITGWVSFPQGVRFSCDYFNPHPSRNPWLNDCVRAGFSDVAGSGNRALTAAITFRFIPYPVMGPVVASVHVNDRRAGQCGAARAQCLRMMVVDHIVLNGDRAFDPRPLRAEMVRRVLHRIQATRDLKPFGANAQLAGCGDFLAAAEIYFPRPRPLAMTAVIEIEIEPSARARRSALELGAGSANALRPKALLCTGVSSVGGSMAASENRWLAIQNVIVLVRTHHPITAADRAFIVGLAKALHHATRVS
jgi:hypothetical protein